MHFTEHIFLSEHIDPNKYACNQEYAGFCNEHCITPKTMHGLSCLANKMGFSECTHENAISNQSNDA